MKLLEKLTGSSCQAIWAYIPPPSSLSRIGTFAEKPEKSALNSPISVTLGFPLDYCRSAHRGSRESIWNVEGSRSPHRRIWPRRNPGPLVTGRVELGGRPWQCEGDCAVRTRGTTSRTSCSECRAPTTSRAVIPESLNPTPLISRRNST